MANVTDRDCRKAANRASTVELPSGPKIFPATATAKITARSRRLRPLGAEASDLHAEDVGHRHRGGRRGVTLRLSFRLIHSCSQQFTGGRRPGIHAARDVADGSAESSKACEGASLPWVQIPPPSPLTCDDASPPCLLRGGGHPAGLSFGPQMVSVDRAEIPCGWLDRTRTPSLHCGGHDLGGDPGGSLSVQVEALIPHFRRSGRALGTGLVGEQPGRSLPPVNVLPAACAAGCSIGCWSAASSICAQSRGMSGRMTARPGRARV